MPSRSARCVRDGAATIAKRYEQLAFLSVRARACNTAFSMVEPFPRGAVTSLQERGHEFLDSCYDDPRGGRVLWRPVAAVAVESAPSAGTRRAARPRQRHRRGDHRGRLVLGGPRHRGRTHGVCAKSRTRSGARPDPLRYFALGQDRRTCSAAKRDAGDPKGVPGPSRASARFRSFTRGCSRAPRTTGCGRCCASCAPGTRTTTGRCPMPRPCWA